MVIKHWIFENTFRGISLAFLILLQILPASLEQDEDIPHNDVRNWALKFGVDLWQFGRSATRMNELQRKYHDMKIDVARKDGLLLIREMASEVKNTMNFKMSAVMRTMDSAEQAAITPRPDNGHPYKYYNAKRLNVFGPDGKPSDGTREMMLTTNPHFDHLQVNTSLSSVLMPPNVDEEDSNVLNAIQWSEHLDPLFVNNYETDPSLSWQFFGSSTGFLRRYPGIAWPPEDIFTIGQNQKTPRNVYDFRSSAWYVNAATSPKDIVILIDNSGSMTGQNAILAKAVTEAILNTLSDNDFVNVYKFSTSTEEVTSCFKDSLVQASDFNKRVLKDSLDNIKGENIANFTSALITGFEILHKYNRTGQGSQCNQAMMLITDGPPSSFKDIFKTYNFPHRPVRMFTYLVGDSNSNNEDMYWMACNNKGYYSRIRDMDEAKRKVLHYIEVMARPMVMYQNDHPVFWSPAYVGGKANNFEVNKRNQLMTTVSTPVFDRRNHSVRVANVLGVVGTDVSIEEIKKLVPAYKLGVNGYSFLVNNNGHVLYHPDLRPLYNSDLYEGTLEPRYVSVDLTEVEQVENSSGPRENHSALLDLRHDMIDQKEGETEILMKVHYDNMKRVGTRRYKYFYKSINGTPFSLGLAIPDGYGMYELQAEQEIKHSQKNVTEFFKGNNWRVHPDWVYCEYTNGESGEEIFRTAEERVLHFLSRSRRPGWKWMSVRPRSPLQREHHYTSNKQDRDAYFCDKTLLQSLVLDARVTEELMQKKTGHSREDDNHRGYEIFGLTLSFVATRSGLLRWTDHVKNKNSEEPHFSENNVRAMDETWYKRAVDQHSIEPESFVFSVPFDIGTGKSMITATHAVFVEHKGHKTPAAVVGLQYQHSTLAKHFLNITSKCSGGKCNKTCSSDKMDCYILDNNGFIIISENVEHTGRFFGQIDGTIMDSLVQDRIYKKIPVYDYQGACSISRSHYSGHSCTIQPFKPLRNIFDLILKIFIFFSINFESAYGTAIAYLQEDGDIVDTYSDYEYHAGEDAIAETIPLPPPSVNSNPTSFFPPFESDPLDGVDMGQYGVKPCDKKVDLYILQPERLANSTGQNNPLKGKLTNCHVTGCERPFSVQKIPHSNLILLVVDTTCPCGSKQLTILPQEIAYENANGQCFHKDHLYRKHPLKCINYHPEEIEINVCGSSSQLLAASFTFLFSQVLGFGWKFGL